MSGFNMYVWEGVLRDYTDGIVVVHAQSVADAWDALYEADETAWWVIQGHPTVPEAFESDGSKPSQVKQWLDANDKHAVEGAPDPVEVTGREAFVLWGGS